MKRLDEYLYSTYDLCYFLVREIYTNFLEQQNHSVCMGKGGEI